MTTELPETSQKSVLDPAQRLSEILFGLIMVLTFTGSLSVATADRGEVRNMLIGAIGCNIAWGLVDAVMYLIACLTGRGIERNTVLAVRRAQSADQAHAIIRSKLPRAVSAALDRNELERIRAHILGMDLPSGRSRFHRNDWLGALGVFLIVVASTFPVIVPFIFFEGVASAMRLSNGVAIAMLAMIGFAYGQHSGLSPWGMSGAMVLLGIVLVALTIALGG